MNCLTAKQIGTEDQLHSTNYTDIDIGGAIGFSTFFTEQNIANSNNMHIVSYDI